MMNNIFINIWSSFKKDPLVNFLFILLIAVTAFILFTSSFEVKYAFDELNSVNNTYAEYYFYRFEPVYTRDLVDQFVFASNKDGMAEKIDSSIEDLRKIDGLHIVINICNGKSLYVYDQLLNWDEEGCSDSEFSLVRRSPDGIRTNGNQVFADKAYFDISVKRALTPVGFSPMTNLN